MWYVMQVVSGKEGQTVLMMERTLSGGILESCFVPMRRMKKKYSGKWQEITEKLFPGYVFLFSGQPQLLYDELKNIPALTKMLGSCEEYFTPLSDEDVHFLRKLQDMQNMRQSWQKGELSVGNMRNGLQKIWNERCLEVELSRIAVGDDGQIRIISGPLKNLAGQIKKINLHKRIAVIETEFMGGRSRIYLGIEIIGRDDG